MKEIRRKLIDQYQNIRVRAMHDAFKFMIIYIFVLSIMANIASAYSSSQKWVTFFGFSGLTLINLSLLYLVKYKVKQNHSKFKYYLLIALLLTVATALSSPGKYMLTLGVTVVGYSIITFMVLSKKTMYVQAAMTTLILVIGSLKGAGQIVFIGNGYPISIVGSYIMIVVILIKSINMFQELEEAYYVQLVETNEMNVELTALNEEYQAVEQTLLYRLDHDDLTQALNRNGFEQHVVGMHFDKSKPFYVVAFDLDNFKFINNSLGYVVGDQVLNEIISELNKLRPQIDNIARTEGNTMMFTVDFATSKEYIVETLRGILNDLKTGGYEFKLSASIGIADSKNSKDAPNLVNNAEMAMSKAKNHSKGSVEHHDQDYIIMMDRHYQIMNNISEALERREFYNLYQPIVNVKTLKIVGYETLVRWESESMGMVFPDEFITICEQTGQIIELGYYIMDQAMGFCKKVLMEGENITVSINLSPRQMLDENFLSKVLYYVSKHEINSKNIAFEITETAYIENIHKVSKLLKSLNDLGFNIYLDDFGTGYSSLSYLHQLPIQTLKIDKIFIDGLLNKGQAEGLVSSLIALANVLKLKVVAEGVEEASQLKILEELGCDAIQGYFFDRPLKEDHALKSVRKVYEKTRALEV